MLPTPLPDFSAFNYARELFVQQAMGVLGVWALLNLLVSGYHVTQTDPRTPVHYFHQMNVAWNVVNALIAAWGVLSASPRTAAGFTLAQSQAEQASTEHILLINLVLDVLYIAIGSWLKARAAASYRPARLQGFGLSLWLQGGFLLVFDAGLYLLYHQYAAPLATLAEQLVSS